MEGGGGGGRQHAPLLRQRRGTRPTWGAPIERLSEVDLFHGTGEESGEGVTVLSPRDVGQRVRAVELGDPALYPYLVFGTHGRSKPHHPCNTPECTRL